LIVILDFANITGEKIMDEKLLEAIRMIMKEELAPIYSILTPIQSTLDEHGQLLKALEHNTQVTRAEQDRLIHDIAHLQGDVTEIKRDMYRMEEATAHNWADIAKLKAAK